MAKPKIRIKGFEGEWDNIKLLDITISISSGKDTPSKGSFPLYGSTGIIGTVESASYEGPLLLIARVGANAGYLQLVNEKCGVTDNTLVIRSKANISLDYLFFFFQHYKLNKFVYGSGQPLITGGMLKEVGVYMGSVSEIQTIVSYFQLLNFLIQITIKKISSLKQMKQACLVSMFPQAGETTPRIRFKGFEGEWEIVKLSSIATRVTRKNSHLASKLPLTISAAEGLIEQTAFFNNVVASSNVSGYYLIKKGEFAYNKSYSNGYPFGAVKRLDRYDKGVLSTLYIVFSTDASVCSDYIVHFFDTSLWHKEVAKRAAEGARNHGLLNIGAEDFLDIDIVVPKNKEEQQRIASFFRSLDTQISLQEQRLEKLKQIKSACLDKMFV